MMAAAERTPAGIGRVFGRWTVVRRSTPAKRRPSDNGDRQRVIARCVCGVEATVWVQDLVDGRSMGCRLLLCRTRNQAVGELEVTIDRLLTGDAARRQQAAKLKARLRHWLGEARESDDKRARERLEEQLNGDEMDGRPGVDPGEWE
jgi:hypothetical protein